MAAYCRRIADAEPEMMITEQPIGASILMPVANNQGISFREVVTDRRVTGNEPGSFLRELLIAV
jgi:hypothetical protein